MSSQNHTKVIIAGGSIAGLTLANILEQLGIDYLVLEKYEQIAPDLGASIVILPNGNRILDQIGCYDNLKALLKGVEAIQTFTIKDENGQVISELKNASEKFNDRTGYEPFLVERQMVIQVLYENLRDKSKVLASKGIAKIEQSTGKVRVVTEDGETFHGEILVGADGVHSTVRREMRKLAEQDAPSHFPVSEGSKVPTSYCCIFGISQPSDKFPKFSLRYLQGHDYSYLVATGPELRTYWFLFKKLPETVYGLHGKIPRFTDEQRDAMAAEHASDLITDTLTFGELYATRRVATLQALPEVVFKQWHHNRITTIGDAAHKFNPISGHGGNSAIEDAAVLADQLHALLNSKDKASNLTDASITHAFEETQRIRIGRANKFLKISHDTQSLHALDSVYSRFLAKWILPLSGPIDIFKMLCDGARGAARVKTLPMPERACKEFWDDEKKAGGSGDWRRLGFVASVGAAALAVLAASNTRIAAASMSKVLLSIQAKV